MNSYEFKLNSECLGICLYMRYERVSVMLQTSVAEVCGGRSSIELVALFSN